MKKIRVAILFGGKSVEHEVSVVSAKNIMAAIDKTKYDVIPIGIDKKGSWHLLSGPKFLTDGQNYQQTINKDLVPVEPTAIASQTKIDVVFPVLHGQLGEDGTVQGLLKLANIPFVGAGVLGSAIGMDKDVQKRLLRDSGIDIAKFIVLSSPSFLPPSPLPFGFPVFVKPSNLGSSVGITKVNDASKLEAAIKTAFQFDTKVLVEEEISGREIEISVLGNENPIASVPGEVVTDKKHDFYSYEAKYLDDNGARLIIPAKFPAETVKKIQETAVKAYKALCCEGMARIDMFVTPSSEVYINEINTIPGFTSISMYPKLWEASGITQTQLIDKLITLALARFRKEQKLLTSR